jgi:hypothetical protein
MYSVAIHYTRVNIRREKEADLAAGYRSENGEFVAVLEYAILGHVFLIDGEKKFVAV